MDEDPLSTRYTTWNALTDIAFVGILALTIFVVSVLFGVPEDISAWAASMGWPLADFAFLYSVLALGFIVVAVRRWHDLRRVLRKRDDLDRELEAKVAELRKANRELERSNDDLEQFAYAASHDLREPLRMIKGYLDLVERRFEGDIDEETEEFIELAVDGADRMDQLIRDLLEYSRVGRGDLQLEPVDLQEVMDDVEENLGMVLDEAGGIVETGELPTVLGDRSQLDQLFQNLVHNGMKFRGDEAPVVRVWADDHEGGKVTVHVEDNGVGIPEEEKDRIFMVFKRLHGRDVEGSGVGLAVVKRIVERHDGTIDLTSKVGEGSTFHITLPVAKGTAGVSGELSPEAVA